MISVNHTPLCRKKPPRKPFLYILFNFQACDIHFFSETIFEVHLDVFLQNMYKWYR